VFVCEGFANDGLFEHLGVGQYFLVSFGNKVVDELVFVDLLTVGNPLLKGRSGELFHEDVPVVEVGVDFAIGVS
jgi:hypothetical protein